MCDQGTQIHSFAAQRTGIRERSASEKNSRLIPKTESRFKVGGGKGGAVRARLDSPRRSGSPNRTDKISSVRIRRMGGERW